MRLGLAHIDPQTDGVSLLQQGFVPKGDWQRMLAFLRDNVSDHLHAAVGNAGRSVESLRAGRVC